MSVEAAELIYKGLDSIALAIVIAAIIRAFFND